MTSFLLLLPLLTAFLTLVPPAERAAAQDFAGQADLTLLRAPVWYSPGDALKMRLRIDNNNSTPLEGFQIRIGVNPRLVTRSDLHLSFDAAAGFEASATAIPFDVSVRPFSSRIITLDEPLSSFSTLVGAENGVYPSSLTLMDTLGKVHSSVSVPLIVYSSLPDNPLSLVLLLPLNEEPVRSPDGTFNLSEGPAQDLAEGLAKGGWLSGWMTALETVTEEPEPPPRRRNKKKPPPPPPPAPLQIAISATPRMLEEIADLADGFERAEEEPIGPGAPTPRAASAFLSLFRSLLAERPVIQPILTPYAFPDLPTLVANGPFEHPFDQLRVGQTVTNEVLDVDIDETWLFAPAERLDTASLEQMQRWGASRTFFSPSSLVPSVSPDTSGCPEPMLSFTCPVRVETLNGPVTGYVADLGLSDRLAPLQNRAEDRLLLQRFFAETVLIREELPGIDGRVVHAIIPSQWHPSPRMSRVLLAGTRAAPWVKTVTPDEGFLAEPVDKEVVEEADRITNAPEDDYFDLLADSGEVIESYGSLVSPESERLLRLRRNILASESRSLWHDITRGQELASASGDEAEQEMGKVTLEGAPEITLTSRQGDLPIVLSNAATYPVDVEIELISENLTFDETTVRGSFEPGRHPLTLEATAQASGAFPLRVVVRSPDGDFEIASKDILIRSTKLNQVALGITIGALAFLVLFYASRPFRRKRRSAEESPA